MKLFLYRGVELSACESFFYIFFGLFVPLLILQLEDWTENGGESEGKTGSKGPQGGIEPTAAAVRTQPLHM